MCSLKLKMSLYQYSWTFIQGEICKHISRRTIFKEDWFNESAIHLEIQLDFFYISLSFSEVVSRPQRDRLSIPGSGSGLSLNRDPGIESRDWDWDQAWLK